MTVGLTQVEFDRALVWERNDTLELAAKACEEECVAANETGDPSDFAYNSAIKHCAAAIRALKLLE